MAVTAGGLFSWDKHRPPGQQQRGSKYGGVYLAGKVIRISGDGRDSLEPRASQLMPQSGFSH